MDGSRTLIMSLVCCCTCTYLHIHIYILFPSSPWYHQALRRAAKQGRACKSPRRVFAAASSDYVSKPDPDPELNPTPERPLPSTRPPPRHDATTAQDRDQSTASGRVYPMLSCPVVNQSIKKLITPVRPPRLEGARPRGRRTSVGAGGREGSMVSNRSALSREDKP